MPLTELCVLIRCRPGWTGDRGWAAFSCNRTHNSHLFEQIGIYFFHTTPPPQAVDSLRLEAPYLTGECSFQPSVTGISAASGLPQSRQKMRGPLSPPALLSPRVHMTSLGRTLGREASQPMSRESDCTKSGCLGARHGCWRMSESEKLCCNGWRRQGW